MRYEAWKVNGISSESRTEKVTMGTGTETKYAMNGDLHELKGVPGTWNLYAVAA